MLDLIVEQASVYDFCCDNVWWRHIVMGREPSMTSWLVYITVSLLLNCICSMYYYIRITIDSLWMRRPPVTLKERWLAAGAFIGWKWTGRGDSWSNWREMAPRPENGRSGQIREGSGLFVLNAWGSKNSVYSVNNFLEFMKNNILYNNIICVCRSNNN